MSEGKKKTMEDTVNPAALRAAGLTVAALHAALNDDAPLAILDREGFLPPKNPQPREGVKVDTGQGLLKGAFEAGDEEADDEENRSFRINPGHAIGVLAFLHVMVINGRRVAMKPRSKGGVRVTIADINFDGDTLVSALMRAAEAFKSMEESDS